MADHRGYWTAVGRQLVSLGERGIEWFRGSPFQVRVLAVAATGLALLFTTFVFVAGTMTLASALGPEEVESVSTPAVEADSFSESDTGDFTSEAHYRYELQDTADKVDNIWGDMQTAEQMYFAGVHTGYEAAREIEGLHYDVQTHTDFYTSNQPPAAYEYENERAIDLLLAFEQGLESLRVAFSTEDYMAYETAIQHLQDVDNKVWEMPEGTY